MSRAPLGSSLPYEFSSVQFYVVKGRSQWVNVTNYGASYVAKYKVRFLKNETTHFSHEFMLFNTPTRVGKRFLSFQNHNNRLDELFRTVHKAKKTLSNSLQDERIGSRKSRVSPLSWVIFRRTDVERAQKNTLIRNRKNSTRKKC